MIDAAAAPVPQRLPRAAAFAASALRLRVSPVMIAVRPAATRGTTLLDAGAVVRHAFSCGDYYDPAHMGFGPVRVVNEIDLPPGVSLARERRANVDILDWVIKGQVRRGHDGASSRLDEGEGHLLGAGAGLDEALGNASTQDSARVLQIWLQPERVNTLPRQARLPVAHACADGFVLLASADGRGGSLPLGRDIDVYAVRLESGGRGEYANCGGRRIWLQVMSGAAEVNGVGVAAGDAAVALNEARIAVVAPGEGAELMLLAVRAD